MHHITEDNLEAWEILLEATAQNHQDGSFRGMLVELSGKLSLEEGEATITPTVLYDHSAELFRHSVAWSLLMAGRPYMGSARLQTELDRHAERMRMITGRLLKTYRESLKLSEDVAQVHHATNHVTEEEGRELAWKQWRSVFPHEDQRAEDGLRVIFERAWEQRDTDHGRRVLRLAERKEYAGITARNT